jgi:hypothetical protein
MDVWGVFSGDARPVAKIFLVIHLSLFIAFILTRRASVQGVARVPLA